MKNELKKFVSTRLFMTVLGTGILWFMFKHTVTSLSALDGGAAAIGTIVLEFLGALVELWTAYLGANSYTKIKAMNGAN